MPEWFRTHGYTTVSVGKISHHPGGRGGPDWNDPNVIEMPDAWDRHLMPVGEWQHPRGAMHGLANGEIRVNQGGMDVFQSTEGDDSIYPDGLIVEEGLEQMRKLAADGKSFFLAVGIIRPHLPFGAPKKYMSYYEDVEFPPVPHPEKPEGKTTWHGFATAIFEIAGQYEKFLVKNVVPISTEEYPTPVRRPANSVLDCSKIKEHFGIEARPWRESLMVMIEQLYKLNAHP